MHMDREHVTTTTTYDVQPPPSDGNVMYARREQCCRHRGGGAPRRGLQPQGTVLCQDVLRGLRCCRLEAYGINSPTAATSYTVCWPSLRTRCRRTQERMKGRAMSYTSPATGSAPTSDRQKGNFVHKGPLTPRRRSPGSSTTSGK